MTRAGRRHGQATPPPAMTPSSVVGTVAIVLGMGLIAASPARADGHRNAAKLQVAVPPRISVTTDRHLLQLSPLADGDAEALVCVEAEIALPFNLRLETRKVDAFMVASLEREKETCPGGAWSIKRSADGTAGVSDAATVLYESQ